MGSTLGVKYDLILGLHSYLRTLVWNVLQACLGVPAIGSNSKKKWKSNYAFFPTETPDHCLLTFLKACGVVGGDAFSPLAPVLCRSWTKKLATPMSLLSTVHCGQYDTSTWYVAFEYRLDYIYCMRHSWRTQFGATSLIDRLVDRWRCTFSQPRVQGSIVRECTLKLSDFPQGT